MATSEILELRKKYGIPAEGFDFSETEPTMDPVKEIARRRNLIAKQTVAKDAGKPKGLLQKLSDFGAQKFLRPVTEAFVAPVARELERPFVSAVRGVQALTPGGKTGKEPVETPFGEVKPYSELSLGEVAKGEFELLTSLPMAKPVVAGIKTIVPKTKSVFLGMGQKLTSVEKPVLERWYDMAKEAPGKVEELKQLVLEYPDEPVKGIVKVIASKLNKMKQTARETFDKAKEVFKAENPTTTFDLSQKIPILKEPLQEFNLGLKQLRDDTGKLISQFKVIPGKLSPWNTREINEIQSLVDKLRKAKNATIDDLIDLRESFARAYDNIPIGEAGPTKYHALVTKLDKVGDNIINDALPDSLKEANKLYRQFYDAMKGVGNKIIDAEGAIKTGAETFLSNAVNLNKGVIREGIHKAEQIMNTRIIDAVQEVKDAQKVVQAIPHTVRSRMIDFLRPILAAAGGAGVYAGKITAIIPSIMLEILSRPDKFSSLIEIMAKTSAKMPISDILKKIPTEEQVAIQAFIKGLIKAPFNENENNDFISGFGENSEENQ